MTVKEIIAELQAFDGNITGVTPTYELDHTQFYDEIHTIRFIRRGEEYNGRKAPRHFVVIDAVR